MANKPGREETPRFRPGQVLSAADLNKLADAIIRRIVVQPPLQVTATGKVISISLKGIDPRGVTDTVLAKITSEVGSGVYNWTKHLGSGPPSGTATELNLSTGIANDTIVIAHRKETVWYFFFPIEEC